MTIRRRLLAAIGAAGLILTSGVAAQSAMTRPSPSATGTLELAPAYGQPGTLVEAVAVRLKCSADLVDFRWLGYEDVPWSGPFAVDGNLGARTTVPLTWAAGTYTVEATCYYVGGAEYVSQSFVVTPTPSEPEPALSLEPTEVSPGAPVTATVTGLACPAEDVVVSWGPEGERWGTPVDLGDGRLTATTTVPTSFPVGSHEVVAECQGYERPTPLREYLTVAEPDEVTPSLTVDPSSGAPGSTLTATATGYPCADDVVFEWDGVEIGRAQPGGSETASAVVTVPSDDATGSHELLARCEYDGFVWQPAAVTVTGVVSPPTSGSSPESTSPTTPGSGPTSPPGPTSTTTSDTGPASDITSWQDPWWPAASVLVALLATSIFLLRAGRGVRWARLHVRAAPGSASGAGVALVESPGGPRWPDISIRIEPHPDTGTQSIEEAGP